MKLKNFLKALEYVRAFDKVSDTLEENNISVMNSPLCESFWGMEDMLFTEAYGEEGWEWVEWYLYELPNLKKKNPDNAHAWDKDNKPIDFSTDDKLWLYLEKEYGKHARNKKMCYENDNKKQAVCEPTIKKPLDNQLKVNNTNDVSKPCNHKIETASKLSQVNNGSKSESTTTATNSVANAKTYNLPNGGKLTVKELSDEEAKKVVEETEKTFDEQLKKFDKEMRDLFGAFGGSFFSNFG